MIASKLDKHFQYLHIDYHITTDQKVTVPTIKYNSGLTLCDTLENCKSGAISNLILSEMKKNCPDAHNLWEKNQVYNSAHYLKEASEVYFVK